MKIICIANNHISAPNPVAVYQTADSSLLREGKPLFLPDGSNDVQLFPSPVIRIDRLGKSIASRFAPRYWHQCAIGFNVRLCDVLADLSRGGLPWDDACSFDSSCPVSEFFDCPDSELNQFSVLKNGEEVYRYSADTMKMSLNEVITMVSRRNTLKIGDMILYSLPGQGIKVGINDIIEVTLTTDINYQLRIK